MSATTHEHHAMPLQVYLTVGAALLALTALTVWVAAHDFGAWNIVIALTIAGIKALLVAFFFMHLFYDHKFYFFIFILGVLFLVIFIGFTMIDTMRRGDLYLEVEKPLKEAVIYDASAGELADSIAADTSGVIVDSIAADTTAVPDAAH